jgi:hypothetical protein
LNLLSNGGDLTVFSRVHFTSTGCASEGFSTGILPRRVNHLQLRIRLQKLIHRPHHVSDLAVHSLFRILDLFIGQNGQDGRMNRSGVGPRDGMHAGESG